MRSSKPQHSVVTVDIMQTTVRDWPLPRTASAPLYMHNTVFVDDCSRRGRCRVLHRLCGLQLTQVGIRVMRNIQKRITRSNETALMYGRPLKANAENVEQLAMVAARRATSAAPDRFTAVLVKKRGSTQKLQSTTNRTSRR